MTVRSDKELVEELQRALVTRTEERDAANDAYYMECRLREATMAERDAAVVLLRERLPENTPAMSIEDINDYLDGWNERVRAVDLYAPAPPATGEEEEE